MAISRRGISIGSREPRSTAIAKPNTNPAVQPMTVMPSVLPIACPMNTRL